MANKGRAKKTSSSSSTATTGTNTASSSRPKLLWGQPDPANGVVPYSRPSHRVVIDAIVILVVLITCVALALQETGMTLSEGSHFLLKWLFDPRLPGSDTVSVAETIATR